LKGKVDRENFLLEEKSLLKEKNHLKKVKGNDELARKRQFEPNCGLVFFPLA